MEDVIAPISKELLKAELTEEKRLRMTNRSHNQIYIITAQDSPNTMKEIGRLREIAFRAAGGGTGKSMDIDEYDIMDNPYKQLIVWKLKKFWVDTVISWVRMCVLTNMVPLFWQLPICLTFRINF